MFVQISDNDVRNLEILSRASHDLAYVVDRLFNSQYFIGGICHDVRDSGLNEFKNSMNSIKDAILDIEGLLSKLNHPDKWDFK